jgi:hypothetical protein
MHKLFFHLSISSQVAAEIYYLFVAQQNAAIHHLANASHTIGAKQSGRYHSNPCPGVETCGQQVCGACGKVGERPTACRVPLHHEGPTDECTTSSRWEPLFIRDYVVYTAGENSEARTVL